MANKREDEKRSVIAAGDSDSTLLPMLIGGLALIVVGLIAVTAFALA